MADRTISYVFRGNFTSLTAGLTAAGRGVQDFGGRLTALDRDGERMRRGLSKIGDGAGKIGLAAAAGLGTIVAVTANFEKAMSRVSAATNASAGDLNKLREAAIQAGADTVFSASGAADGITELGKAGLSTSDILSGGLSGALNLAAAGQLEVADAANITATTLQQFGLAGDQASRVADVLSASANKAMGDVADMAESLKYVGPVASQMGLSLEETAGAIAELAQQGILGSQSGTALRGMMTSLTSPSKQASLTMEGLGISMYDAQGEFVGLEGIAGQLHDTMGTLTNAERDQALGRIFGNEQITAARILYSGGAEAVADWTSKVTDSGFAAEQAATLTNNLSGDIEQLKGSLETAFIETGTSSQGPLRGLTQNLTDVVNGYSGLPGPAKTATAAALGLTAALGGGTFLFAKAIGGLASLQTSMVSMGMSATRAETATRALGRVAGATAGLGLLAAGLASTNKAMAGLEGAAGGAMLGFAVGGPWGAAIGGAIGLVATLGKTHGASAEDVNALTSTLDAQTGALTENSREWAIKTLRESGALDTASALGINLATVTDAALGNADAIKQVSAAVKEYQGLHQGGDGEDKAARGVAEGLNSAITDTGGVLALSREQFKQHAEAMGQDAAAADTTAGAMAGLTQATTSAGGSTFQTAEEVAQAAKDLEDARKAAESAAQGFFNLGDSVNDAKVSLGDWIGTLEKQADALRNFRRNAVEAADKGLRKGLIQALQDAGPEGALRLGQLANASESEIGRANKAWRRGQAEIAAYTAEVTGVPKSASTTLTVQDQAAATIARIKGQLASIPKSVRTDYYVNQINAANKRAANKATGGYIAGPGTSTSDSIPARLSNGEYVIKASSVAKYGVAMFDTLNAQQFARGGLVGFADGGSVGDDDPKPKTDAQRRAAAKKAANAARARRRAHNALGDLDVNLTINADGASQALDKFSDDLDRVRGLFKDAHLKWSDALKKQAHALTSSARQFDSLNATLAQTKADSAAFAASVGSSVSSASLTGNGLAGFEAGVAANTNDTNAAAAGLTAAVANGLDGALFDFLATSGDANLLGQFGGLSAAQIQQQENSYNALLAAQSSFGTGAANVKYAASIDAQTKAVKDMKQSIENLEKRLPGAVEEGTRKGAEAGSRAGNKDSDKTTTQNTQTSSGGGHRHRRRP